MPNSVRVNSGPTDRINLNIDDKPRQLIANWVGIVITIAAEINIKAQSNPERWAPVSVIEKVSLNFAPKVNLQSRR